MEEAVVDGARIAYEVSGAGEPVVLIGGSGMPIVAWDVVELRTALTDAGYRVLAFAARGVAPSDAPPAPYTVADLAADTAGLLDQLGWSGCRVVGVSLGGMVAEVLARARPDLVRAVVLIASAGPTTALARVSVAAEHAIIAAAGDLPEAYVHLETLRAALPPEVLRDDDAQVEEWARMLGAASQMWSGDEGRRGQHAAVRQWLEDTERMTLLSEVTAPCLVVAFEHDLYFPPRCGRQAAEALPAGEFVEIPGAAHNGIMTESATCRDVTLGFFSRT